MNRFVSIGYGIIFRSQNTPADMEDVANLRHMKIYYLGDHHALQKVCVMIDESVQFLDNKSSLAINADSIRKSHSSWHNDCLEFLRALKIEKNEGPGWFLVQF